VNRWVRRQREAATRRHRSPTGAGIVRTRGSANAATPTRGSVTNVGRDLARTAFFHADRRLKRRPCFAVVTCRKTEGRRPIGGTGATCAAKIRIDRRQTFAC
jgi:hypothetical protein